MHRAWALYQGLSCDTDPSVQYPFGYSNCFCRSDLFRGNRVPHLVKQALNTSRPLVVIPGTFLGGAVFCMLSDLIARTAFAPLELNISTVTSIFGAPVVIAMMLKRQKGKQ